jgi:hypothetical protein
MKYRLKHVEGLEPAEDTDSQRMGSSWHALHEVYGNAYAESQDVDAAMDAAIEHLNERYADRPDWIEEEKWATERQILATCFAAYHWYYSDDPVETLTTEQSFDLPLHEPKTGMPLPRSKVCRHGTIDGVIRYQGYVGRQEYKSTTRSIEDGSDYWDRVRLDDQVSMYDLAFADMPADVRAEWGVRDDDVFGHTLYDVWHKPTIKPTKLTQKDTVAFIEDESYYGDSYEVQIEWDEEQADQYKYTPPARVLVDGEEAAFELGKNGWTLRETVTMFGSRLMADIAERPEFYFRRRIVVRTMEERTRFRTELYNIYRAISLFEQTGCWYQNGSQCRATFPCEMIPICHGPTHADAVCDGETTPTGFQRSTTTITVGGQEINK